MGGKPGQGARGGKATKGRFLEHQVQQALSFEDNARSKLLTYKGAGGAHHGADLPAQPLEMKSAVPREKLPPADAVRDHERYNDALMQRIAQRCKAAGVKIPPPAAALSRRTSPGSTRSMSPIVRTTATSTATPNCTIIF